MRGLHDDRTTGERDCWVKWQLNSGTVIEGMRSSFNWFSYAGYAPFEEQDNELLLRFESFVASVGGCALLPWQRDFARLVLSGHAPIWPCQTCSGRRFLGDMLTRYRTESL